MNTLDELVTRGVTRVQHDTWPEGQYLRLVMVKRDDHTQRMAPNAMQYTKGKAEPEEVPVYALAGNGEEDWRPYVGPKHPYDVEP